MHVSDQYLPGIDNRPLVESFTFGSLEFQPRPGRVFPSASGGDGPETRWFEQFASRCAITEFAVFEDRRFIGRIDLAIDASTRRAAIGPVNLDVVHDRVGSEVVFVTMAMAWLALARLGCGEVMGAVRAGDGACARAFEVAGLGVRVAPGDSDMTVYGAAAPPEQVGARWDEPGVSAAIQEYWERQHEREHRAWLAGEVLRALPLAATDLLEVGCGSGLVYDALQRVGVTKRLQYSGIDRSYTMLATAVLRHPAASFRIGDLFALSPECADVVLCVEVLGHLPRLEEAIVALCRAARSTLIFSAWVGDRVAADEVIAGASFLHNVYSRERLDAAVRAAMPNAGLTEIERNGVTLFVVRRAR